MDAYLGSTLIGASSSFDAEGDHNLLSKALDY